MTKRRRKVTRKQLEGIGIRKDQFDAVAAVVDLERADERQQVERATGMKSVVNHLDRRIVEEEKKAADQQRRQREWEIDQLERYGPAEPPAHVPITERLKQERAEFDPAPNGPTVVTSRPRARGERQRLQRGCGICGQAAVWVFGGKRALFDGHAGYVCRDCDRALDAAGREVDKRHALRQSLAAAGASQIPATDTTGLAVTRRLRSERPDLVDEATDVLENWRDITWLRRVFDSEHPERQQPPAEPFDYLLPPNS